MRSIFIKISTHASLMIMTELLTIIFQSLNTALLLVLVSLDMLHFLTSQSQQEPCFSSHQLFLISLEDHQTVWLRPNLVNF